MFGKILLRIKIQNSSSLPTDATNPERGSNQREATASRLVNKAKRTFKSWYEEERCKNLQSLKSLVVLQLLQQIWVKNVSHKNI